VVVVEENKRTYVGAEISDEVIDQIKKRFIDTKEYPNMSEFLRSLIDERLDPQKGLDRERKRFLILCKDPTFRTEVKDLFLSE